MAILVSRFIGTAGSNVKLHSNNWHVIVLVAFMVAQKIIHDIPLANSEFVEIIRVVSPTCDPNNSWSAWMDLRFVNHVERAFLGAIHFDVFIKRKVYIEFMLELNAFQASFQGNSSKRKPLCAVQARAIGLSSLGNSANFSSRQKQKETSVDAAGRLVAQGGLAVLN
jgi:hypothetical protein